MEPLLGGCYWPQSYGQCQAAKALAALRFQSVLPQGLLCREGNLRPLGFLECVLMVPTSHPIYHGKEGHHPAFYPVTRPGVPLQVGSASSRGCCLGISTPLPSLATLIPVLPRAPVETVLKTNFRSPTPSKGNRKRRMNVRVPRSAQSL